MASEPLATPACDPVREEPRSRSADKPADPLIKELHRRTPAPPRQIERAELAAPPVSIARAEAAATGDAVGCVEPKARRTATGAWLLRHRWLTSFVASAVVHALLLVVLGLLMIAHEPVASPRALIARLGDAGEAQLDQLHERDVPDRKAAGEPIIAAIDIVPREPRDALEPAAERQGEATGALSLPLGNLAARVGVAEAGSPAGALAGRRGSVRGGLLSSGGGNRASEDAVARGLRWLEAHQQRDGSWNFNHQRGSCGGACSHPGNIASTTGATALALLPFLGAGHTHREGDYQTTVERGLYYLRGRMRPTADGGDFQEGTMYAQGLSAIALCEALAMTGDSSLRTPAEAAIDFIVYAQDKQGGGWRYSPGQPGDMTVTGWQLMSLRSGQMNYLRVPSATIDRAIKFLDSLGEDRGATYGYLQRGSEPTSTAVGLLCRMFTGWPRSNPALVRGVKFLSSRGPSPDDIYFNYYATQVLHHWGGAEWIAWNQQMRDQLVDSQSRNGHESGSWFFEDKHQAAAGGGRLYTTCMAIMTLEVYYRYLPIYGDRSTPSDF
ncbi:MAG TPA: prenyltransferase/squalene oxidase repeat-containing protein [Pirellulales bacterium]|jgi:hypothetical protein|nr:prenyltransferase/squalene oxidase repeat-containing protein [Pirellulales bacterium]